jgi:hypothetical protein
MYLGTRSRPARLVLPTAAMVGPFLGLALTLALALAWAVALTPPAAAAPQAPETGEPGRVEGDAAVPSGSGQDSRKVREQLTRFLDAAPPELGMVLRLDPSLLRSPGYLAPYPELASFVAAHPEVAQHPAFFLEDVRGFSPEPVETVGSRMAMRLIGDFTAFAVFLVVTAVLAWLVKTLIAQRRWSRLSRIQTEVHGKLLDRLASNEELLVYVQSPAGRRFLESAPIPVEDAPSSVAAPVARILWSVQAGVVLVAAGIGLWTIARGLQGEAAQAMSAFGTFSVAIGIGALAAAGISAVLSQRLGLWPARGAAAGTGPGRGE